MIADVSAIMVGITYEDLRTSCCQEPLETIIQASSHSHVQIV